MNLVNKTGLKIAPLRGRLNFPKHSATWVVKGTFDLKHDGKAILAKEQAFPTGDEFYPDDKEQGGSPRYESDFAFHKPLADLMLVGACYAPQGRPTQTCAATFRVGSKSKTIAVVGNRRWERRLLSSQATEPEPFARMELRYENSFGGPRFPANPVGKGTAEVPDGAGGRYVPLPNIEDPANSIVSRGDQPLPAGFGPLGRGWAERHEKVGTYKGAYRKTRWPWFPEDFDWRHFNAAPPDLQIDGFLRGDESLLCQNLHPRHAVYESQLPGLRVRCFVRRVVGAKPGELRFDEVQMKLDTLWVDMEVEKLVLVWRGWCPVASEECEDIRDVFVTTEPMEQPPALLDRHYQNFLALIAATEKPFEPEAPPPPPPASEPEAVSDPAATAAAPSATQKKQADQLRKELESQVASLNAQLDVDKLSPKARQQFREAQSKLIERLASNDPMAGLKAERVELHKRLSKFGLDADNLPPLGEQAQTVQARFMKELGFSSADLQANPELAQMGGVVGALLAKAGVNSEKLEPILAKMKERKKELGLDAEGPKRPSAEEPTSIPPPTAESVRDQVTRHGSLEGADLRGLDLSGLDLKGADLAGANLSKVSLRKTDLTEANLSKANLTEADFTEANLTRANAAGADFSEARLNQVKLNDADLSGANFGACDLSQANLDGALLDETNLSGARLMEASALGASFVRADLSGANLQKAMLAKADFSQATLRQANLQETDLAEACVIGAKGHQINLAGAVLTKLRAANCDFSGAKMTESKGNGSMWKAANLSGGDLRYANMEEAMFTAACLKEANLSDANMKFSRFNKANLTQAKLQGMNLFQGNLEKANLALADLRGANLYEVEFLEAVFEQTNLEGANLKMTKLDT